MRKLVNESKLNKIEEIRKICASKFFLVFIFSLVLSTIINLINNVVNTIQINDMSKVATTIIGTFIGIIIAIIIVLILLEIRHRSTCGKQIGENNSIYNKLHSLMVILIILYLVSLINSIYTVFSCFDTKDKMSDLYSYFINKGLSYETLILLLDLSILTAMITILQAIIVFYSLYEINEKIKDVDYSSKLYSLFFLSIILIVGYLFALGVQIYVALDPKVIKLQQYVNIDVNNVDVFDIITYSIDLIGGIIYILIIFKLRKALLVKETN